jgi:hypothetical protein
MKLSNFFEKRASSLMTTKRISSEFSFLLFLSLLLKLITSFFSIIVSYFYVFSIFQELKLNFALSISLTIIILFVLELFVQLSLSKLFKFLIKTKIFYFLVMLISVFLFFSISLYLSVKGVSIYSEEKTNTTELIKQKYKDNEVLLKNDLDFQLSELDTLINVSKKQTWHGKLSDKNLERIIFLNNEKIRIRNEHDIKLKKLKINEKKEIKEAELLNNSTSKKYTFIIFVILVIQLISNLFLSYFYFLIFKEDEKYKTDYIKNKRDIINTNIESIYSKIFDEKINFFKNKFNTDNEKVKLSEQNKNKKIGFISDKENKTKNNIRKSYEIKNKMVEEKNLCKYCNQPFVKNHHKQVYCSESCRIKFWEQKENRQVYYKKKK